MNYPFWDVETGYGILMALIAVVHVFVSHFAIGGGLTAIYAWESPGGWHLLGRCPVPLFDARREAPSLLAAGDRVRFEPVSTDEYRRLEAGLQGVDQGQSPG